MGHGSSKARANGPPGAGRFIVTVYGDVVEPRGGTLWMGSLIAVCQLVGISESLVRTSVSRLVAAGRLEGERQGRRSFYRLTEAGAAEFQRAGKLIFGGARRAEGWCLVHVPDHGKADRLETAGFARIGPGHLIGPDVLAGEAEALLRLKAEPGTADLSGWAAALWPLQQLAADYRGFLAARAADAPVDGLEAQAALAARLMLVHDWRRIVLTDPRLPQHALPHDWPGTAAARAFARRYLDLTPAAEQAIAALCQARDGSGLASSPAVATREAWLTAMLGKSITPNGGN